jgi:hypothetical protein
MMSVKKYDYDTIKGTLILLCIEAIVATQVLQEVLVLIWLQQSPYSCH